MDMNSYLEEIEYAASGVIQMIRAETKAFEELDAQIRKLESATHAGYERARAWQESDDPDDVAMGAGIYWETYFGADKERHHKHKDREALLQQIDVRRFSLGALSGNLLHYGKQGISVVYGGPDKCPNEGRKIGSQRLADVIWCGRNQSLHWEEAEFKKKTTECFNLLTKEVCKKFGDYEKRNEGFHLVYHLGWTGFNRFKDDLLSLG